MQQIKNPNHPFNYSLGHPYKFDSLANLAKKHNCWRKVARTVCKYNKYAVIRMSFYDSSKARRYIWAALANLNVPEEIKQEFVKIYKLTPEYGVLEQE